MPCLAQRFVLGGALVGLTGSGIVVVVGAPTVILSVAGAAAGLAALVAAIDAIDALRDCFERRGNKASAERLADTVQTLQAQVADLQERLKRGPD